ncbi:MAG: Rrf2 family transcriptional regulator [Actinobacteria bacterium]|nr:Rrf2 family transcriptional regulator [Actinomycetota bacterium]
MRLTNKTTYGIEAMYYLAEKYIPHARPTTQQARSMQTTTQPTQRSTPRPVPISEIAKNEKISKTFLEKIFKSLKKAGLVKSIKGVGGGYVLALPPSNISIIQILNALGEPIGPTFCVEEALKQRCQKSSKCVPKKIWQSLRIHIKNYLNNTTLEDLLKIKNEELTQV